MVVVGKQEVEDKTLSVRTKKDGNIGVLSQEDFFERIQQEQADKN